MKQPYINCRKAVNTANWTVGRDVASISDNMTKLSKALEIHLRNKDELLRVVSYMFQPWLFTC